MMSIGHETLGTHKYAAATRSFCFVTTENGGQQDIYNLTTTPSVQRSLYLNEMTYNFGHIQVEVTKGVDGRTRDVSEQCMSTCGKAAGIKAQRRSRTRKEASAKEVGGYYKQFVEAKHLEYKSWVDNEVFDLVDLGKVKTRNHVNGRWVPTIKTYKQGNFFEAKARWVLRGFRDKLHVWSAQHSAARTRRSLHVCCRSRVPILKLFCFSFSLHILASLRQFVFKMCSITSNSKGTESKLQDASFNFALATLPRAVPDGLTAFGLEDAAFLQGHPRDKTPMLGELRVGGWARDTRSLLVSAPIGRSTPIPIVSVPDYLPCIFSSAS